MHCHCAGIAEQMGLDGELIGGASRLHDVGMDGIAERAAPLTPAERTELLDHPRIGHALLTDSGLKAFELASQIALTHHERFDGTGYPQGLTAQEIPLAGRIVAVADTFDALTTDRVYRPAGTVEHAVATLREERGRQLDPDVVDVFLDGLDEAVAVLEQHPSEQHVYPLDANFLTLQAAADLLGMSASRLRRLADDGWIEARRTPGGHRRFPEEAVRRLACEHGVQPSVRPLTPPAEAIPQLAAALQAHGRKVVTVAATAIYGDGPPGWFSSRNAEPALSSWVDAVVESAEHGDYAGALAATQLLMRQAHCHATTVLERHLFLERVSHAATQVLLRSNVRREVLIPTRRLFVALQQALLE